VIAFEVFVPTCFGRNSNLLCAPVVIGSDRVWWKHNERPHPGGALKILLACALRPLAVPNGHRDGRFLPSRPIGSFALERKLRVSRSAWIASTPGKTDMRRNASLSRSSAPLSRRGQKGMPDRTSHASKRV